MDELPNLDLSFGHIDLEYQDSEITIDAEDSVDFGPGYLGVVISGTSTTYLVPTNLVFNIVLKYFFLYF